MKPTRMYAVVFKKDAKSYGRYEVYNTKKEAIRAVYFYARRFDFDDVNLKEARKRGYDVIPVIVRPA